MEKKYDEQLEKSYNVDEVIEEASRCLLCHEAVCSMDCPAGTDPARFIRSARFHNFKGGAATIRQNNALGAVCALVCPTEKYCQRRCPKGEHGGRPIEIGKIQAFLTNFEQQTKLEIYTPGVDNGRKVAIIGSGPSGLQAAVTLRQLGYQVTIYEKDHLPGGYMRYGIPEYRLPHVIVDHEIERIRHLGVKIITDSKVSDPRTLVKDFDAIIYAPGFAIGKNAANFAPFPQVEIAVDFLKRVKTNNGMIKLPKNVLVIGGGDVAMDTCSTLKLLGVPHVNNVIYETFAELRASQKELEAAQKLGVPMFYGTAVSAVNDKVITVTHRETNETMTFTPDLVILAIGQTIAASDLADLGIVVNQKELQTKNEKIFISGDIAEGEKTVVYAVRNGKLSANAVHEYLSSKESK